MCPVLRPLTLSDFDEAFDLATEVFVSQSTLHKALGVETAAYRAYLAKPFRAMLDEGLSLGVFSPTEDQMLGCVVVTDWAAQSSEGPHPFPALQALGHAARQAYQAHRSVSPGETVLVDMAAVAPDHQGRGLYRHLRQAAETHAAEKGFRWVLGELSSPATQALVLGRLGHKLVAEIPFARIEVNGSHPFATIPSPESLVIAEGDLRAATPD